MRWKVLEREGGSVFAPRRSEQGTYNSSHVTKLNRFDGAENIFSNCFILIFIFFIFFFEIQCFSRFGFPGPSLC